jgi:hypothetical protein
VLEGKLHFEPQLRLKVSKPVKQPCQIKHRKEKIKEWSREAEKHFEPQLRLKVSKRVKQERFGHLHPEH